MAMSPSEIERKVHQLDNDVLSIYDILGRVERRQGVHDRRFDAMDARLDAIDRRLDAHDARFDTVDSKLDSILALLRGGGPTGGPA